MTAGIWPSNYGRRELPATLRSEQQQPLPSIAPAQSTGRLSDFESFADYAARARKDTLDELRGIDIPRSKRNVVYSFGAGEGFLLDRINRDGSTTTSTICCLPISCSRMCAQTRQEKLKFHGLRFNYLSLAPTGTSSKKPASTGFPPSMDAATIIPFDSRPRSFLGSRLATMTTFLPTSVSGA